MNHTRGTPEVRLWSAIIYQALYDAKLMGRRKSTRLHHEVNRESFITRDAHTLLRECRSKWMRHVCSMASQNHSKFVREVERRLSPLLGGA